MIALLDIDGVLVDFESAALQVHGVNDAKKFRTLPRQLGVWDMTVGLDISMDEFWKPIDEAGAEFWEGLEKYSHFDTVLNFVHNEFTSWYLCSAPSRCPTSYTGKVNWIQKEFGRDFDRFFLTPHKEMLANPGRCLIDDRFINVQNFSAHGGHALLFPSLANNLHKFADDPISCLKSQKNDYLGLTI